MGDMAALWGSEENHDMEQLGQKLLYTTLELEKAKEEMRKNKDYITQLIHLLKYAIHERDEAKHQLQKLLNNNNNNNHPIPSIPIFQKANSSITESNSLSDAYNNYHSHNSSPVESLFDTLSSSDFSNNAALLNNGRVALPKVDQGSFVIDDLVKGRVLPQKGKFLQAVLQAGPLLNTLLVAGPLPRWRNPPQMQAFKMPPVSIRGCEVEALAQRPGVNVGQSGFRMGYGHVSCGSAPMLNFGNMGSGMSTCLNNGPLISSGMNGSGYAHLGKRQRLD